MQTLIHTLKGYKKDANILRCEAQESTITDHTENEHWKTEWLYFMPPKSLSSKSEQKYYRNIDFFEYTYSCPLK